MASDIGINLTLTADAGQAKSELQSLTHAASSFNTEMRSAETVNPYKASAMALQQAQQNSPDKASAMALQQAQQNSPDKASAMALQQAQQQSVMQKFGSFFRPKTPITVDTTQAKTQIEELSRIIEDLTEKMKKALEVGDGRSAGSLSIALQNATTARRTLMAQVNQAQTTQPRLDSNAAWVIQQSMTQITRGILSSMDAALSAATQRASGDYTGAAVTKRRATGEIWGQGIGTAAGVGIGALLTPLLGPMAIPLVAGISGEIGKFLGGKDAKKMEESLAYSAQYKQALPAIDSLNQIYGGDIGRKLAVENNRAGLSMYERAGEAARGTGLSTRDFVNEAVGLGAYGIRNFDQAMNMARSQALWSRRTGVDIGAIQEFEGKVFRFSGRENAADTAYAGLLEQGMGNGQFGEFLNAMERIMEEGIEKGFVRGTEEIAGNLSLMYKLSGESPLWQGEQGAKRLSQMNAAISSATDLQSVEDVITYSAARNLLGDDNPATPNVNEREANFIKYGGDPRLYTGTYVDPMIIMERGVQGDLLRGQRDAVEKFEGGNLAAQIERYMKLYNVNYAGGARIRAMMAESHRTEAETGIDPFNPAFEQEIKDIQGDRNFQSDSATLQDILNDLHKNGVKIGAIEFKNVEIPTLEQTARDILEILRAKEEGEAIEITNQRHDDILERGVSVFGGDEFAPTRGLNFQLNLADVTNYKNTTGFFGRGGTDYGEDVRDRLIDVIAGIGDPSKASRLVMDELENFASKFYDSTGWLNGVNEEERHTLFSLLDNIEALNKSMKGNTEATMANTNRDFTLNAGIY